MNINMMVPTDLAVENIASYENAKVGADLTAEADWTLREVYTGLQVQIRGRAVQNTFDASITERDIKESLAFLVPKYAAHNK